MHAKRKQRYRKPGRASTHHLLQPVWNACTPWHGDTGALAQMFTVFASLIIGSTVIVIRVVA